MLKYGKGLCIREWDEVLLNGEMGIAQNMKRETTRGHYTAKTNKAT